MNFESIILFWNKLVRTFNVRSVELKLQISGALNETKVRHNQFIEFIFMFKIARYISQTQHDP